MGSEAQLLEAAVRGAAGAAPRAGGRRCGRAAARARAPDTGGAAAPRQGKQIPPIDLVPNLHQRFLVDAKVLVRTLELGEFVDMSLIHI